MQCRCSAPLLEWRQPEQQWQVCLAEAACWPLTLTSKRGPLPCLPDPKRVNIVGRLQGYLVDAARLAFDIYVTVQSNASSGAQALHLGPTEPFSATPGALVTGQLLGDLSSYNSMPDFSSFYLMIPSPAGAQA